jgi:hypothetical protein
MAIGPHVNGPAIIYVSAGYDARSGAGGTPTVLAKLGVSVDGVEVDVTPKFQAVKADTGGPDVPVTEQATGFDATLRMDVVLYDGAVLVTTLKQPGQTSEGLMEAMGYMMAPADYHRLFIAAPNADGGPYNFPTARLARRPIKLSTLRSIWRLEWYAFAYVGVALTSAGAVLYNSDTTNYTP